MIVFRSSAEGLQFFRQTTMSHPRDASHGFAFTQERFREIVEDTLAQAKQLGASDAGAEVSEGMGLSVSVRKGELENVERNRDKSLGVSVYLGQRRGNASTSDFSAAAVRRTVQAAYDIARFTAEDPAAGLPEAEDLAGPEEAARDLDLYHPWDIDAEAAAAIAHRCEDAALAVSPLITNSEGAGVSAQQAHFWAGNTRGFRGGYASSRHYVSVAPIASLPPRKGLRGSDMQRDAWYTSMRDAQDLAAPVAVGRYAAERALARLGSRRVRTGEVRVLFEAPVASGLLGHFVSAVSGGNLYRKSSFLVDSIGQKVFSPIVHLREEPHLPRGLASTYFDDDGVATQPRDVVKDGIVQGYFLGVYSARKLGMRPTGSAGGNQNLLLEGGGESFEQMLKTMGRGLLVTELMGQGINLVTGDYSRGAAGYWVENGVIQYPVEEITIAGNLRDMFKSIVAIGGDALTRGSRTCGSILIDSLTIAGE